jgi:hypothetical protein
VPVIFNRILNTGLKDTLRVLAFNKRNLQKPLLERFRDLSTWLRRLSFRNVGAVAGI